jgi:hypothetical protein
MELNILCIYENSLVAFIADNDASIGCGKNDTYVS